MIFKWQFGNKAPPGAQPNRTPIWLRLRLAQVGSGLVFGKACHLRHIHVMGKAMHL